MCDNFFAGEIQHFPKRVIACKTWFVFRDLPELAIEPFDDVRRI